MLSRNYVMIWTIWYAFKIFRFSFMKICSPLQCCWHLVWFMWLLGPGECCYPIYEIRGTEEAFRIFESQQGFCRCFSKSNHYFLSFNISILALSIRISPIWLHAFLLSVHSSFVLVLWRHIMFLFSLDWVHHHCIISGC